MRKAKIPTAKDWKKFKVDFPKNLGTVITSKGVKREGVITRKPFKREIEARKMAGVKGAEVYRRVSVTKRYINMLAKGERKARQDVAQVFKAVKSRYKSYVSEVAERRDITIKEAKKRIKEEWRKSREWYKYA